MFIACTYDAQFIVFKLLDNFEIWKICTINDFHAILEYRYVREVRIAIDKNNLYISYIPETG